MSVETLAPRGTAEGMRRTVRLAAILNLAYFGIEFAVAVAIGSVSLFADSIDFLEDTSVNFLILLALNWSARNRARMGMVFAGILLGPGIATLWTAWRKFTVPVPPSPLPLSLAGAGALAVNLACAIMLARYRLGQSDARSFSVRPQRRAGESVNLRGKTVSSFLQLLGAGCLVLVVLAHVSDALHLFPWMHWDLNIALAISWTSGVQFLVSRCFP